MWRCCFTSAASLNLISYMRMSPLGWGGSGQRRNTQSSWPSKVTWPGMSSAFSGKHRKKGQHCGQRTKTATLLLSVFCSYTSLTCRLGSGEDELCRAATLDLSIAGVNVNAVHSERLQARDLQPALRHSLFHEIKLSVCWLHVSQGAAVTSGWGRRETAAVGVQTVAAGVSGVGDAKEISAATIWRPGREGWRYKGRRRNKMRLSLF